MPRLDLSKATDKTPMRISDLARYLNLGRRLIDRDVAEGYVLEFSRHRLTTPAHYKAWLRRQAITPPPETPVTQERQQRELHRLRSAADKSHAPL